MVIKKAMPEPKTHRKLPLLSEVAFFPVILVYAILHAVFLPLGIESAVSMLLVGSLFGILFIPVAFLSLCVQLVEASGLGAGASSILLRWVGIPFLICYVIQILVFDKTHITVKHASPMHPRNVIERAADNFLRSAQDYLQMRCIPWAIDASLSPSRQYVFGVHPHGIHCMPLGLFSSKGSDFDHLFPGLVGYKLTGLAASVIFKLPLVRELFINMGYVDASRSVANAVLADGRSLFICTGGEEESMLTTQGEDIVVLKRRKGFVRLALAHGADLVPVFGVGNTDLYRTYDFLGGFRRWLQKSCGIALPIFHGRFLSPLAFKKPVTVLIGEPIQTPEPKVRGERPSEALVDEYHRKYIRALMTLHAKTVKDRKLIIK